MKKIFQRGKLSTQIAVVSWFVILVPTMILWFTMIGYLQNSALKNREQEAELRCSRFVTQVERIVEVANMSTQVFLNTPGLIIHLTDIKQGKKIDGLSLIKFYRQDISSLEKIVISNPELYEIRVYAANDDMNEMMPILYAGSRMQNMPWAQEEITGGTWHLNYKDEVFLNNGQEDHLLSLVTPIDTASDGRIGVLEVSMKMDEVLPELFEQTGDTYAVLLKEDGTPIDECAAITEETLAGITFSEKAQIITLNGTRCLVLQRQMSDFGGRYIQISSLADLDKELFKEAWLLVLLLLVVFVAVLFAVSAITRRMLGGFYKAFDGIRAFADGDIDAQVKVQGEDEVAQFAKEVGGLLDKIRQLMIDNLEQERQAQSAEIRALHNQINAHFIYNVLEAIKMMAEIDEEYDIADAVANLGRLLRYSMKWVNGNVMLQKEIDYIRNYIALMNLRFDYELSLQIEMPEELYCQRLPKISLQPIVENAIIHGTASLQEDSVILLKGELDYEQNIFFLHITDKGQGMDEEQLEKLRRRIEGEEEEEAETHTGNGIGLHNVHSRIQKSFGKNFGLTVTSVKSRGTTVTVTLPYQSVEP